MQKVLIGTVDVDTPDGRFALPSRC